MSFRDAVDRRRVASLGESVYADALDEDTYNEFRAAQHALEAVPYEAFSELFSDHATALQKSVARGMTLASGVQQMGLGDNWKSESDESVRRQILNQWIDSEWITAEDGASLASLQGAEREELTSRLLAKGQAVNGMKGLDIDELEDVLTETDDRFGNYIDAFGMVDDRIEESEAMDLGE